MKNYTLNRLLVLFASGGFLFLGADTIIEHFAILPKELSAFIGPVFSIVAAGFGFAASLRWNESRIRLFQWVLIASIVVGGAGMYYHLADDDEDEARAGLQEQTKEKEKPPLAPLAFAGIAAVGLLGTVRKWHAEVVTDSSPGTPPAR